MTTNPKCYICKARPRIKGKSYCCPCLRPIQIARRKAKWDTLTEKPICRKCQERPVARALWIYGNIRCYPCFNNHVRRNGHTKYIATQKGQIQRRRNSMRRFVFGGRTMLAKTPEQAAAIRAHIRELVNEFVAGQSARAKAEGLS